MRPLKTLATAVAAAGLFTATHAAAATDLVANGSFETPAAGVTPNTSDNELYAGTPSASYIAGWTVYNDELSWIGPTNSYGLQAPAGGGSYFLDLTGTSDDGVYGGIRQVLNTTAGATYQLTFQLGGKQQYGLPSGLTATAGSTSQNFLTTNPDPNNAGFWQLETMNFVASGSTTSLSFIGTNSTSNVGLDSVSVMQISAPTVSAAPEPGAWALMLGGIGMLGAMMRIRKARLDEDALSDIADA